MPGYMAPEIILGYPYRKEADIFSLGVVLFNLLSRKNLFFASDVEMVFKDTLTKDIQTEIQSYVVNASPEC